MQIRRTSVWIVETGNRNSSTSIDRAHAPPWTKTRPMFLNHLDAVSFGAPVPRCFKSMAIAYSKKVNFWTISESLAEKSWQKVRSSGPVWRWLAHVSSIPSPPYPTVPNMISTTVLITSDYYTWVFIQTLLTKRYSKNQRHTGSSQYLQGVN